MPVPTKVSTSARLDPRLKDNRVIFGGLFALLVILTLFYTFVQRGLGVAPQALTNKILLFVLWYVNIILILIILFVLIRSLFRLIIDHRSRILGSRFQTKLVLSAVALSLIPVLILFPFATRLLLDSLEAWFDLPIGQVVELGRDTADALADQIEHTNLRDAKRVLDRVADLDLGDLEQHPELKQRLNELREELETHYIAIYDDEAFLYSTADPRAMSNSPNLRRGLTRFLGEAIEKSEATQRVDDLNLDGRLMLAARARPRVPTPTDDDTADVPPKHTVVMVGTMLATRLADQSDQLVLTDQAYDQIEVEQDKIKASYRLILLMMTLMVVLAFTSISTRLARRVTAPIAALAEGTRRIRDGDLDHQVEVAVDDELGVLVDGFNRMTRELKQSNRELVEANEQVTAERLLLDAVLQNVAAGVMSIDAAGRVLTCNGAALRMLAQPAEAVIGRPIDEAWADDQRGKLVDLLEKELPHDHEFTSQLRMTVGGVWKTLEVKINTLPDTSGRPGGRVVVLEDLTELIQAQKMATWNEVARRIAHEIKNPLTPIKLTAERLLRKHQKRDPELGAVLEDGVETIGREVETLKNMVDEFSRFARMPRPKPTKIDLQQVVAETVGLYTGIKPGIELETKISDRARHALFDPSQLKSVLINLLDNAMQAVDPPGTITVSTSRVADRVDLAVADTGQGISDESKAKLFLPYFSTKGRGTGLGLAIVHRIVTDHHAAIRVERNQPRGTIFVLELPAS